MTSNFSTFRGVSAMLLMFFTMATTSGRAERIHLNSYDDAETELGPDGSINFNAYLAKNPNPLPKDTKYSVKFGEVHVGGGKMATSVMAYKKFGIVGKNDSEGTGAWQWWEEEKERDLSYIPEEDLLQGGNDVEKTQRELWEEVKKELPAQHKNYKGRGGLLVDVLRQYNVHMQRGVVVGYATLNIQLFHTIEEPVETAASVKLDFYCATMDPVRKDAFNVKFGREVLNQSDSPLEVCPCSALPHNRILYLVLFDGDEPMGHVGFGAPTTERPRPAALPGRDGATVMNYFRVVEPPTIYTDLNRQQVPAVEQRLAVEFIKWVRFMVKGIQGEGQEGVGYGLMLHLSKESKKWKKIFNNALKEVGKGGLPELKTYVPEGDGEEAQGSDKSKPKRHFIDLMDYIDV